MNSDRRRRQAAHRGRLAEIAAAAFLHRLGYQLLGRNLRLGSLEIDIVARDGPVAVVVEVRSRGAGSWGNALASIGTRKQRLLRRAARRLWAQQLASDRSLQRLRFDVVVVHWTAGRRAQIEHIPAAFH